MMYLKVKSYKFPIIDLREETYLLYDNLIKFRSRLEYGGQDNFKYFRGIVILDQQPTDDLSLDLIKENYLVIDNLYSGNNIINIVDNYIDMLTKYKLEKISQMCYETNWLNYLEFSKNPPWFNQELYDQWLVKLSQPWNENEGFNNEET